MQYKSSKYELTQYKPQYSNGCHIIDIIAV